MEIFSNYRSQNGEALSATLFGDNIDYLRRLPDNYYDIILADPPYFSGPEISNTGAKRKEYITDDWEKPTKEFFEQIQRTSRHQIVFGVNYFTDENNFGPGRIIWDKVNGSTSYSDCEIAHTSFHYSVRLFRYMWNGMCQGKSISEGHIMQGNKKLNEKRIHQTQKPIALYKWIYHTYLPMITKEIESRRPIKILDTHLGSGTSRIAALDFPEIEFCGIEVSAKRLKEHEKWFKNVMSQQKINFL